MDIDETTFSAYGIVGAAREGIYNRCDLLEGWDSSAIGWSLWMYDNRYYMSQNPSSTTVYLNDASEFREGWYICLSNDEDSECVQIQSINYDNDTLTFSSIPDYGSFLWTTSYVYKFEPTRYELSSTCWTGSTTLEISATPFFEEGDEIFITHTGAEPTLEWDTIDTVSTNGGTTITLDNGFDSSYTTEDNSYIWGRPKFGR